MRGKRLFVVALYGVVHLAAASDLEARSWRRARCQPPAYWSMCCGVTYLPPCMPPPVMVCGPLSAAPMPPPVERPEARPPVPGAREAAPLRREAGEDPPPAPPLPDRTGVQPDAPRPEISPRDVQPVTPVQPQGAAVDEDLLERFRDAPPSVPAQPPESAQPRDVPPPETTPQPARPNPFESLD